MNPLLRVVLSVDTPALTGVARLLINPGFCDLAWTARTARWARRPWLSLRARLREAMTSGGSEWEVVVESCFELATKVRFCLERARSQSGASSQSERGQFLGPPGPVELDDDISHLSTTLLHCHCTSPLAMASALRPVLVRQTLQRRVLTSTLPAFRQQLLRQPALQRAPFQTTPSRAILPPLPQRIEGNVNDPAHVPEPEPSHGSYHWTAERYGRTIMR